MGDNRFVIDGDGTITRTISDLDSIILNILRVGANKTNILAAYKARKKCSRFIIGKTKCTEISKRNVQKNSFFSRLQI